ncbi:MAG TPA: preprotein translocase subunit YajC [Acidimicrobiales bacterium]|jgi:preprotein translocase subunit YajC|nr:preprotein translocase subunit YajC [Acidimicrobiales bacterium]
MSSVVLLFFLIAGWLLVVRPQQQRLRAQRALVASLSVGDRVVTAGGIVGTIVSLDDQEAAIEAAPGIVMTFVRPAVSRRLEPVSSPAAPGLDEGGGAGDDGSGNTGDLPGTGPAAAGGVGAGLGHTATPAEGGGLGHTATPADGGALGHAATPADGGGLGHTATPAQGGGLGHTATPADGDNDIEEGAQ